MVNHRRRDDPEYDIIPRKIRGLIKIILWFVMSSFAVGMFWYDYQKFKSDTQCQLGMLIDVVVYHKAPERPRCAEPSYLGRVVVPSPWSPTG